MRARSRNSDASGLKPTSWRAARPSSHCSSGPVHSRFWRGGPFGERSCAACCLSGASVAVTARSPSAEDQAPSVVRAGGHRNSVRRAGRGRAHSAEVARGALVEFTPMRVVWFIIVFLVAWLLLLPIVNRLVAWMVTPPDERHDRREEGGRVGSAFS